MVWFQIPVLTHTRCPCGAGGEETGADHVSDSLWREDARTPLFPGAASDPVCFRVGLSSLLAFTCPEIPASVMAHTKEAQAV